MFFRREFKISINGRAGISYEENDLMVHIDSEMLNGENVDLVVFIENSKEWRIEGAAHLPEEKIQLIKSRVRHKLRNIRVEWH